MRIVVLLLLAACVALIIWCAIIDARIGRIQVAVDALATSVVSDVVIDGYLCLRKVPKRLHS